MGLNRNCSVIADCVFSNNVTNETLGFGVCLADETCSCLSEFGWSGDFCNEVSPQVWLNRFLFVLRPLVIFFLAIYCTVILVKALKFKPKEGVDSENMKKTKRRLVFMVSLNLFACLTLLTYINGIVSLYDPTYLETIETDSKALNGDFLDSKNGPLLDSIRGFGYLSIATGQALLAASWIDLVEGMKEFSKHKIKIYFMVQYRRVVPYFILAFFLLLIVVVSFGTEFSDLFPVIGVLSVLVVALLIFGSRNIITLLKEFSDERKTGARTLIIQSSRIQIYGLVFSVSVFSIAFGLQQSSEPEIFFLGQKIANANFMIPQVCFLWGLVWYCSEILKNMIVNNRIQTKQYSSVASKEDA